MLSLRIVLKICFPIFCDSAVSNPSIGRTRTRFQTPRRLAFFSAISDLELADVVSKVVLVVTLFSASSSSSSLPLELAGISLLKSDIAALINSAIDDSDVVDDVLQKLNYLFKRYIF